VKYNGMPALCSYQRTGNGADPARPTSPIPWSIEKLVVFFLMLVAASFAAGAAAGQTDNGSAAARMRVEAAVANIVQLVRPKEDGVATVWDGNKFVQCRHMVDDLLRCEAAGTLMQPTLARVLTADRASALVDTGWLLDPSFGNYVQIFPAAEIADKVIAALKAGYNADLARLEVRTSWIARRACPPRAGPSQNLAGSINDSPQMAAVVVTGCAHVAPASDPAPLSTVDALVARDGPRIAGEIGRLRVNAGRRVFAVFKPGIGYVQCAPETDPLGIYCEAQSVDEWPALAALLTRDRVARLHELGFSDPGRAPNYWQVYDADKNSNEAIARSILTVLFDVYGYRGAPALRVLTEK
jgi:hypothetical protein